MDYCLEATFECLWSHEAEEGRPRFAAIVYNML